MKTENNDGDYCWATELPIWPVQKSEVAASVMEDQTVDGRHSQSHLALRKRVSSAVLRKWPNSMFVLIMIGWVICIVLCPRAFWDLVILALSALACVVYARSPNDEGGGAINGTS
jgi:hypothetical protein